ncbi:MAG: indole-3-glycerol phosphate synthase TrpC [Pseudomonadota bacterium]
MTASILTEICTAKRAHVAQVKAKSATLIREGAPPRSFHEALKNAPDIGIIAEVKRASPSQGRLREDFDIQTLTQAYLTGGASCLSVLTDTPYFHGSDDDLVTVRKMTDMPILRKDFMIDPYQITESWALGADCVLVILTAVSDSLAAELIAAAQGHGLDVLAEVHDRDELDRALALGCSLIGVNNRNLHTLAVDLATGETLLPLIPPPCLAVAESGMKNADDLMRMHRAGAHAALVGQSLCQSNDPAQSLRALRAAVA